MAKASSTLHPPARTAAPEELAEENRRAEEARGAIPPEVLLGTQGTSEWPAPLPYPSKPCTLCFALCTGFARVFAHCKARAEEIALSDRRRRKVQKGLTEMREAPAMFIILHDHSAEPIEPGVLSAQLRLIGEDPEAFMVAYL